MAKRRTSAWTLPCLFAGLALALCAVAVAPTAARGRQAETEHRRGDFNGDGYADVAMGAPRAGDGGAVRVLYGSASGLGSDGEVLIRGDGAPDGASQFGALFGASVSSGDFDADGFGDLAVGAPGEDVSGVIDTGAVYVFYGSAAGLSSAPEDRWTLHDVGSVLEQSAALGYELQTGDVGYGPQADLVIATTQRVDGAVAAGSIVVLFGADAGLTSEGVETWTQHSPGVDGRPENHDQFGISLAVGDFDGDGYDDLAVGSYESVRGVSAAGAINVLYGSESGVSGSSLISQRTKGVGTKPRPYDQFGIELAAGDFNGDGWFDVAAGAPGEAVQRQPYAGAVYVLLGSPDGITGFGSKRWTQANERVVGHPKEDNLFGQSLSSGEFGRGEGDDLAVGTYETVNGRESAGAVHVLYGAARQVMTPSNRVLTEAIRSVPGGPGERDYFGWALASGDIDANGFADLIVGVPGDDLRGETDVGTVRVFHAGAEGLSAVGSERTDGREGAEGWGGGIGRELASATS